MTIKKQWGSTRKLLLSQKRLEKKIQKEKHLKALEMPITFFMISKEQSSCTRKLLVSQSGPEKRIPKKRHLYENLGIAFQSLGDFSRAEEFFKRSIKLFEEIRVLLQEKDEWKISFRNQFEVYNFLCSLQIQQGKTTEALSTAEWGRAQALADLMESQYGVNSTLSFQKSIGNKCQAFQAIVYHLRYSSGKSPDQ